jgi:hypothetical protein
MKMSQLIKDLTSICLEAHKVLCTRESALGTGSYVVQWEKRKVRGNVFIGLALVGKKIVFRFIIEYSSLRYFGP